MEFIKKVKAYDVEKTDIKKVQEEEKEIFNDLPHPLMILNFWDFFEDVHTFFCKICENRSKIYKGKKEAIKNSYFYENVYDKLGSNIEKVGDGSKNVTNRKLEIGRILNCSWPPNNSSTFKREYRRKLKEIATIFLDKNKIAFGILSDLWSRLDTQSSILKGENSCIESESIELKKTSFKLDELTVKLSPVMKGWTKDDVENELTPILKIINNGCNEKNKNKNEIENEIENIKNDMRKLNSMKQSLCLDPNNKPVTRLRSLCLEFKKQV